MIEAYDHVEAGAEGIDAPPGSGEDDPIVALLARFPVGRPFSAEEAADYGKRATARASHEDVLAKVRASAGT
jgi:hypothetical protein